MPLSNGMKEKDTETVVELVDRVLINIDDDKTIKSVSEEVKKWMKQFPLYPELD